MDTSSTTRRTAGEPSLLDTISAFERLIYTDDPALRTAFRYLLRPDARARLQAVAAPAPADAAMKERLIDLAGALQACAALLIRAGLLPPRDLATLTGLHLTSRRWLDAYRRA